MKWFTGLLSVVCAVALIGCGGGSPAKIADEDDKSKTRNMYDDMKKSNPSVDPNSPAAKMKGYKK